MKRERRIAAGIALVTAGVFGAYVVIALNVTAVNIGHSDYTATYAAGVLWRDGHRTDLYDGDLQGRTFAGLIAPDTSGSLAFPNPPTAAVIASAFTWLPLTAAYHVWGALQMCLLGAAAWLSARAAPWPAGLRPARVAAAAGIALPSTLALLLLGQWSALSAAGLAAAYALWVRGDRAAGGAVLALSAALSKPHLALGLAAFLLGRRDRRILAGAAAATAVVAGLDLLAIGPAGIPVWVSSVQTDAARWRLSSLLGFNGFSGSWLGDGTPAQVVAAVLTMAALAVCAWLGSRVAHESATLERGLAGATLLSLVSSPHLLAHDLVLLVPVVAWCLADAARRDAPAWPGTASLRVLLMVALFAVVELADLGNASAAPPGRLVPLLLAGTGVWITVQLRRVAPPAAAT